MFGSMSSLDSTSTFAEARAAFRDSLSYRTDQSTAKALALIEACEWLREYHFSRSSQGGSGGHELEIESAKYSDAIDRAEKWIANNPSSSRAAGPRHFSFENFRG